MGKPAATWRVMRQDDNGNRFVVAENLTESEARQKSDDLAARGHKQLYWAEPIEGPPTGKEDLPVCIDCKLGKLGFPCRSHQGAFLLDKVALALRDYGRLFDGDEVVGREEDPPRTKVVDDTDAWAFDCVCELVEDSPDLAVDFVLRALAFCETNQDVAVLAAGPLEELLKAHGAKVIRSIEVEAEKSARFRLLLSGVWGKPHIDPAVWRRVKAAVRKGPWLDLDPRTPQGSEN